METPINHGDISKMADKTGFRRVSSGSADEHDMSQIREILFGEYSRHTNGELDRLRSRLNEQDTALRELLDARISKAMDSLQKELHSQETQQQAALDALEKTLHALLGKTDERLSLLDSDLQDTNHRLEQSNNEQTDAVKQVQRNSVDRSQLAEFFEGLARQLRTPSEQ